MLGRTFCLARAAAPAGEVKQRASGALRAVRQISKASCDPRLISQEVHFWQTLDHPSLVRPQDFRLRALACVVLTP